MEAVAASSCTIKKGFTWEIVFVTGQLITLQHQLEKGVGLRTFKRCLTYASDMFETHSCQGKSVKRFFFLFFILKNTLWVLIFSKTLLPMEAKTVNQLRCAINICLFVPCLKILFTPSSSKKKNIPIFYRYAHATWSRWRWQFFVIVLSFYRTLTWTWRKWATEPAPTRGVRSVIRLHCSIRSSIIHAKQDCTKTSANFQTLYHLLLPNWQCRSVSIFRKK